MNDKPTTADPYATGILDGYQLAVETFIERIDKELRGHSPYPADHQNPGLEKARDMAQQMLDRS